MTAFFLGLSNNKLDLRNCCAFCAHMNLWRSIGFSVAGACLASPQNATSLRTGMKNYLMLCAWRRSGLGTLAHFRRQWWKTLLACAHVCQDLCMLAQFPLVPLGNTWWKFCGIGQTRSKKNNLGARSLGTSWIVTYHYLSSWFIYSPKSCEQQFLFEPIILGFPRRPTKSVTFEPRGIYIYGDCAKFFCTKMALAPALGEPCEFLARPQSRLSFWLSIFSFPLFLLVFV